MSKKAAEPEKPENHERWIVSYADMLTLLFALFVVLYATSDANPNKLKIVKTSIDSAFSVGIKTGDRGCVAPSSIPAAAVSAEASTRSSRKTSWHLSQTLGHFAKQQRAREQ